LGFDVRFRCSEKLDNAIHLLLNNDQSSIRVAVRLVVSVQHIPVLLILTILRHQDEGRCVRGLHRQE
jgi:hypothetical protein